MADIIELIEQAGEKAGLTSEMINKLKGSFNNLTQSIGASVDISQAITSAFEKAGNASLTAMNAVMGTGKALKDTSLLTQSQVDTLGLLSSALIKTSKSFESFQTPDLNTFTGQLDDVIKGIEAGKEPLDNMRKLASSLGIKFSGMETLGQMKNLIMTATKNMAENADEALRFQNAILQTSAAAGSFNQVIQQAGDDLKNLNSVIVAHEDYLSKVEKATQAPRKAVEDYYIELSKIPGALQANVRGSAESQHSVNMLTASMQFAQGSGRKFKEVVEDLNAAFVKYDLVGEDALQFTSRIGQLSNKYNVQLSEVRKSVMNTADSLKMFGHSGESASKMMEGASRIMNNYIGALKDTGVSGASAVNIVENMTKKVGNLDVAMRSFISSQTGGAGGLRGAFQIEQMIREGNIDEVMEKVRQSMTQQFGRIVSVEEAAGSERAASMLVKQREMLRSGPLGALAGSEQEAGRMLEAFATMGKGGGTEDLENILQSTMDRGAELQKQTATPMSMMRADTNAIKGILQASNLANLQQMLAGSVGTNRFETTESDAQRARRAFISGGMKGAAEAGGRAANLLGSEERINDNSVKLIRQNIDDIKETFGILPETFKGMFEHLDSTIFSKAEGKLQEYKAETARMREQMEGASDSEKEKLATEISNRERSETAMEGVVAKLNSYKEQERNRMESTAAMREATTPDAMRAAAKSRYDFGEETAPARVAAAIPETGPAVAAAGGVPGRGDEGERSEVTVKIEPETLVFELRDEEGKVSSQSASLSSTQNVKRGK